VAFKSSLKATLSLIRRSLKIYLFLLRSMKLLILLD